MSKTVSIHPYFQAHKGKLDDLLALVPELLEITSKQDYCLWYDFSVSEEGVLHCREAYEGAEGLLHHCAEVDPVINKMLQLSDVIRCEIHGPQQNLKNLKNRWKI